MSSPLSRIVPCLLLLAGCTLAPRYQRPDAPVARDWPATPGATAPAGGVAAADVGWRDFFEDPRLQALVALALEENRDLRVAVERVELARAQYRIERAPLLPSVGGSASFTRQRVPADLSGTGQAVTSSQLSVGAGVSAYELDLFGRVRSLADAARAQYLATGEARRAAQLAVVSEVAAQYLAERATDEQLALARRTLEAVQATCELTRRAHDVGRRSELDLRAAEGQVETARAAVASQAEQAARARNALVLLVGRSLPDDLPPPRPLSEQRLLAELPAGVPSEVLTQRPDVLQAEQALVAANASIGAARAAFFPSITLTAFGGTSSAQLSGLFSGGSGTWSFAPSLNLPIFTGGRNRANLDAARSQQRLEVAQYEKAIQVAFREVADGLATRALAGEQVKAQSGAVGAERRRLELAELRYRQGLDSYLSVLTAQQDLYRTEQALIQAEQARLTNLVQLYKALGGGWRERTRAAEAPPAAASAPDGGGARG
ncbi:efflux transporter outer membrane subunit [Anaeromyxobacter paludicola]|uniref:Multidrug transporter n=1 Tax=Anaeromyxobacter paludicola TaxID=2918171 RepID=A0ABM7XDV7_9BACT|nr:efflux transporter outer membrane subunit [Anaeromyxobacter paludicola]BDG10050.1 multidrug transporter [Anaeromyxobacter paludicola]